MTRVTHFQSMSAGNLRYWVFHLEDVARRLHVLLVAQHMACRLIPASGPHSVTWSNDYTTPEAWADLWNEADLDPEADLPSINYFTQLWR